MKRPVASRTAHALDAGRQPDHDADLGQEQDHHGAAGDEADVIGHPAGHNAGDGQATGHPAEDFGDETLFIGCLSGSKVGLNHGSRCFTE